MLIFRLLFAGSVGKTRMPKIEHNYNFALFHGLATNFTKNVILRSARNFRKIRFSRRALSATNSQIASWQIQKI